MYYETALFCRNACVESLLRQWPLSAYTPALRADAWRQSKWSPQCHRVVFVIREVLLLLSATEAASVKLCDAATESAAGVATKGSLLTFL